MLVGLKNKESQLLSRKLCLRFVAGLLTYSFILAAFPKPLIISGIMTSIKSLQQRELSGTLTRFPIEPLRHHKSLQKYKNFLFKKIVFSF